MPLIPALLDWKQEDESFRVLLSYRTARRCYMRPASKKEKLFLLLYDKVVIEEGRDDVMVKLILRCLLK